MKVVEAKFGTGNLKPAQRALKKQLGKDKFTVSRTSYDEVSAVGGGAVGNCIEGAEGPCQR